MSKELKELKKKEKELKKKEVLKKKEAKLKAIEYKKEETKRKNEEKKGWFHKSFNKDKLKKPNKVSVIYLRNNGRAEPMIVEVEKGQFNINGKTYHERSDCTYSVTKDRIPLAIIPEWGITPIGNKEWYDIPMERKFGEYQDHVIRAIRHAELVKMGETRGISPDVKKLIGWGILILIAVLVITQYI